MAFFQFMFYHTLMSNDALQIAILFIFLLGMGVGFSVARWFF